jgi:hypothetical protein
LLPIATDIPHNKADQAFIGPPELGHRIGQVDVWSVADCVHVRAANESSLIRGETARREDGVDRTASTWSFFGR